MSAPRFKLYRVRDLDRVSFPTLQLFAHDERDAVNVASLRLFGIDARHATWSSAFVPAIGAVATVIHLAGGSGPDRRFTVELVADEDVMVRR